MSADVWIRRNTCETCGRADDDGPEVNITYNLSPMLRAAGFVGWQTLVGMLAIDAGHHLNGVLNIMAEDPERFRAMNPPNGWGDYDKCLQGRLREFAAACVESGERDRLGGSL